jgi:hypothetical protein
MAPQKEMAAAQKAASPSPAAARHVTPSSVASTPTWLPLPPMFVPNCSRPLDLNATGTAIRDDWYVSVV